jgi:murein DD-endopeptidase / murein LD-carboxypeptidase
LKKVSLLFVSLVMLLCFQLGSASAETVLEHTVDELMGTKYKYGGVSPETGFDCSGFTKYVFSKFGFNLTHQSKAQNKEGYWIPKEDLRQGDLVFFNTDGSGISHVGIYLGDGEFVHSATDKGIVKNKLSEKYYVKTYVSARRILWDDIYNQLTAEASK